MERFVKFMFGVATPFVKFINNFINMPFSKKHITGDHYYLWRDTITKGHVFLASTSGVGTNLINVSALKHGAIYYGRGLKTAMEILISTSGDAAFNDRLIKILRKYNVQDDICYVIESVYDGVVPTSLVKFLTTKDVFVCTEPKEGDRYAAMETAADNSLLDLGLEYDYRFSENNGRRYCFEVVGNAYEGTDLSPINRTVYKFLGIRLYSTFMATSFVGGKWRTVIDSRT